MKNILITFFISHLSVDSLCVELESSINKSMFKRLEFSSYPFIHVFSQNSFELLTLLALPLLQYRFVVLY